LAGKQDSATRKTIRQVMKNILIDAVYITGGGGTTLLAYMLGRLRHNNLQVDCLIDNRLTDKFPNLHGHRFIYLNNSEVARKKFYRQYAEVYSKVLCFSNVPPPVKLEIPVITFFQNKLLLSETIRLGLFKAIPFWLKRIYIFLIRKNTDLWVVQTTHMHQQLEKKLRILGRNILIFPFFPPGEYKEGKNDYPREKNTFFYITSDTKYKNNVYLMRAWIDLYEEGYHDIRLFLTIKEAYFRKLTKRFGEIPPNIVNLEFLPQEKVGKLYSEYEYMVFPSLVESFGLPLIEASQHSCKVIAADLPYVNEIIRPTHSFDPFDRKSFMDIIRKSQSREKQPEKNPVILVKDKIGEFILLLIGGQGETSNQHVG